MIKVTEVDNKGYDVVIEQTYTTTTKTDALYLNYGDVFELFIMLKDIIVKKAQV